MTFPNNVDSFEQNKLNGALAEKIACADLISNGFVVEKISHGGDFAVNKIDNVAKVNESIIEVKYNKSKLSKKQIQMKQKLKKNYLVYHVSEPLLDGFKNNESAVVIPNTLSMIMGDNIPHGSKYRIAVPSECPHCRKVANTLDGVVADFGLRIMKDGSVRDQSWCNECRWGARK
jgi:hypothetical protein